jgi:hypothetical protein
LPEAHAIAFDDPQLALRRSLFQQNGDVFSLETEPLEGYPSCMADPRPKADTSRIAKLLAQWKTGMRLDYNTLTDDEKSQVVTVLGNVESRLKQSGWVYSVNNWWWQGGCVVASEERAKYLVPYLPRNWSVTSYTHFTMWHTWNVIYFTADNQQTYYWRVDTYLAATTLIDYLGTTIPTWMYKTPGNGTYEGGAPGKGF